MISVLFVQSGTGEQIATVQMPQVPRVGEFVLVGDWTSEQRGAGDFGKQVACVERVTWELNRKLCNSAIVEISFGERLPKRMQN